MLARLPELSVVFLSRYAPAILRLQIEFGGHEDEKISQLEERSEAAEECRRVLAFL